MTKLLKMGYINKIAGIIRK